MKRSGFTMAEIMVSICIIGLFLTPLVIERNKSLQDAQRSLLLQEVMRVAEIKINEIYFRGYEYFLQSGDSSGVEGLGYKADFLPEEIRLADFFDMKEDDSDETPEGEEAEQEIFIMYHITVTVTSKEDKDVSVTLSLDIPADTIDIEGVESLLKTTLEERGINALQ